MNFDSEVASNTNGITLGGQICFLLNSGKNVGVLGVPQDSGDDRERRQRFVLIATFISMAIRNVKLLVTIEKNIFLDGLTGCFNKTHGVKILDEELKRAKRTRNTFSVIMFDLDSFKSINDEHGHLCGDALLTALGKRMQRLLRNSDVKCRYGGDEFLVLLPDTSTEGAVPAAEILRQEISKLSVLWKGKLVSTTASVGVTVSKPKDREATVLIERVDAALYHAKHLGRNQVYIDKGVDEDRLENLQQSMKYS
jgi:diguanylate cyclase (GGDEF)-like protein